MIRENDSLKNANESLNHEKQCLMKNKDLAEGQINALTKSLEAAQKDLKDKEKLVFLSDIIAFRAGPNFDNLLIFNMVITTLTLYFFRYKILSMWVSTKGSN